MTHVTSEHSSASEPTRERVRATIGQVGGYWRPLAAVARLQEELGELAELALYSSPDVDGPTVELAKRRSSEPAKRWTSEPVEQSGPAPVERWASELADLWIISTALADQFLGAVAEPDSYSRRRPTSQDLLGGIVAGAGQIARIVNYYDGPKTPRSFEGWISLSDAVADFHRALADMAHAYNVDLVAAVSAKLDAIPALDSGRFRAVEHDPSTAVSLDLFRALIDASAGPNGEGARLWGSPGWSSDSIASNVDAIVADLASFTRAAPWERLDGYVICGPAFVSTALSDDWLTRLLAEITARDPAEARSATGPVHDPKRCLASSYGPHRRLTPGDEPRLTFNGLDLLVTVFSSPYGTNDPRHSPVGTFVLMQVEDALELRRSNSKDG